jgi:DNA-binding LytR/AlgR family response regulator
MIQPLRKYSCLVVDDEPPAREVLRRYIEQIPMLTLVGECANAFQALSFLKQQQVDILLLDIQMPQISGIEFVGALSQQPKVLLTTAFEQYAVKAFELDVVDYLLKPIRFDRFLKAIMKALPDRQFSALKEPAVHTRENTGPAFLYFRADRKMVKVFLNDIHYVESLKDYIKIYTPKGVVITKYTMATLESMLPATSFLRVHRSFLIPVDKISSFTLDEVDVRGKLIPIGKIYRQQVFKLLNSMG